MSRTKKAHIDTPAFTVGDVLDALAVARDDERWTTWPPDVFAVVATILRKSGAYTRVVQRWPPTDGTGGKPKGKESWLEDIKRVGKKWRVASKGASGPPSEVRRWWQVVMASANTAIGSVSQNDDLCYALLQLCSAADEASAGAGIPAGSSKATYDEFEFDAIQRLTFSHTLCRSLDPNRIRVLPKLHAPRSGMTLRSLTHNLALCPAEDVAARWRVLPGGPETSRGLNLLLLPWPTTVVPRQFYAVPGHLNNMPPRFGFFGFQPDVDADALTARAIAAHDAATRIVGPIHGVVLPELALTKDALESMRQAISHDRRSFLVAGVCEPPIVDDAGSTTNYGRNYVAFDVPILTLSAENHEEFTADGRSDGGTTGYPILAGIHPVFLPGPMAAHSEPHLGAAAEKG